MLPTEELPDEMSVSKPRGIGGWLIVPMISLILALIVTMSQFFIETLPLIQATADPLSDAAWMMANIPNFEFILWLEVFVGFAFVLVEIALLALMVQKYHHFPLLFIVYLVLAFLWITGDAIAAHFIFLDYSDSGFLEENIKDIVRGFSSMMIWSIYMLNSKRVRNTFGLVRLPGDSRTSDAEPAEEEVSEELNDDQNSDQTESLNSNSAIVPESDSDESSEPDSQNSQDATSQADSDDAVPKEPN